MRMKIVAIFGCILIVGSAFAHSGASGIVKERMDNMKAIAGQMKVLGDMMKGEATFDHQAAKQATEALLEHASHVAKVFEKRNLDHPTEALPLIWEDWEGFTAIAAEMERDVARLNDVIASQAGLAPLKPVFNKIAASCRSCHEKYRIRK